MISGSDLKLISDTSRVVYEQPRPLSQRQFSFKGGGDITNYRRMQHRGAILLETPTDHVQNYDGTTNLYLAHLRR